MMGHFEWKQKPDGVYLDQTQRLLSGTQGFECNYFQAGYLHQVLRKDRRVEMEIVTERSRRTVMKTRQKSESEKNSSYISEF